MTYRIIFRETADKEWQKLDGTIQQQFKQKIAKILENPKIEKNRLAGFDSDQYVYKIKLRKLGYRLVYQVYDTEIVVEVITVGKRNKIYQSLFKKL